MYIKLAKGDIKTIGQRLGCTRQYVSEVISAYRNGIVRSGKKASKIIKTYKAKQDRYQQEQKECNKFRRATQID